MPWIELVADQVRLLVRNRSSLERTTGGLYEVAGYWTLNGLGKKKTLQIPAIMAVHEFLQTDNMGTALGGFGIQIP
jgi:hypothetical protein